MMRRIARTLLLMVFATAAATGAVSAADPPAPPLVAPGAGGPAVHENRIGPGFGPGNCLTTVLSGGVDLEFCSLEYHVEAGAVFCSGLVELRDGIYHLGRAYCDVPGRVFYGGSMSCGRGYFCDWRPSRAAVAEGFVTERVKIYFPEPARFRFRPQLRT